MQPPGSTSGSSASGKSSGGSSTGVEASEGMVESRHREGLEISPEEVTRIVALYGSRSDRLRGYDLREPEITVEQLKRLDLGYNNVTYDVGLLLSTARSPTAPSPSGTQGSQGQPHRRRFALRLTNAKTWWSSKVQLEAEAIRFISTQTTIPVPYLHFASSADPVHHPGFGLMLFDWVEGAVLTTEVYNSLSEEEKQFLAVDLAGIVRELRKLRFDGHGMIGLQPTCDSISESCTARLIPFPDFACGRSANRVFPSTSVYFLEKWKVMTGLLQERLGQFPELAGLLEFSEPIRRLIEENEQVLNAIPIVATHGDIAGRNIILRPPSMEAEGEPYRIVATLLDWEWLHSAPMHEELLEALDDVPDRLASDLSDLLRSEEREEVSTTTAGMEIGLLLSNLLNEYVSWVLGEYLNGVGQPGREDQTCDLEYQIRAGRKAVSSLLKQWNRTN